MQAVMIMFWISIALLLFCYIGYGFILFVLNFFRKPHKLSQLLIDDLLPVTLIVAIYNEKEIIAQKINNTLALDYPPGKLRLIFITDGSTDGSDEIVSQFPIIQLLHQQERKGKIAAIKRAMQFVQTPVVVFSDANAMLNKECLLKLVQHYQHPTVGAVAGEKKIKSVGALSAVGEAEGIYWRYESFMKKQDAGFYTVTGAAGELFSIRTHLFQPADDEVILDDFIISMKVCLQGYKIAYEPSAFAVESPSASLAEEEKRKVRISAGAYQSIGYLKECMNIFKHPLLGFQFITRRLLRWIVCPLLLIAVLIMNIYIVIQQLQVTIYTVLLILQFIFYIMVIPGGLLVKAGKKAGIFAVPFYFVFMNYCLAKGFIRFIQGKQSVLWEKSLRQAAVNS